MKAKITVLIFTALMTGFLVLSCSKGGKSLNSQLDDLEKIIEKYEPQFRDLKYSSKQYNEMVQEYNKEIGDWASTFENARYEKDSDGKMRPKQEFKDVEKRFYELNNRMTRMVLATIPKKEKPVTVETGEDNTGGEQH